MIPLWLKNEPQPWLPPRVYLGVLMLVFPLLIFGPTHLLLNWLFG